LRVTPGQVRNRLKAQVDQRHWQALMALQKAIQEFTQLHLAIRQAEAQLARLEGPLPNQDICPECHYLEGRSVALEHLSAAGKDSPAMSCPACGLEVVPG
jgi:hypothetical protein